MIIPAGKLPVDMLAKMLRRYSIADNRVIVGPAIGEDATAIDIGERYLIAKTDPITFVAEDIGMYAININANDIATMGGMPMWFLATILLPEDSTTPELVERIFHQLSIACGRLGISLCGGHTEITPGINRPILIGTMLGEVEKGSLIKTGGARVGDDIILTKGIAIEGTSILAREKEGELENIFGRDFVQRCRDFIDHPGISVLRDAQIAMESGEVHSMHDPTEGGLATGLYEITRAADVGLIIEEDCILVLEECRILCEFYGIDPLGLIASGALLITVRKEDTDKVIEALRIGGINASKIGEVVSKEQGIKLKRDKGFIELPLFERDEIVKVF
jgi:hydrogenase maturation factor